MVPFKAALLGGLILYGLAKRSDLNGKAAKLVEEFHSESGRWQVHVAHTDGRDPELVGVKPMNLKYVEAPRNVRSRTAVVHGSVNRPEINGREVICHSFSADRGRWVCEFLEGNENILLKSSNLLYRGEPMRDPIHVADIEGKGKGLLLNRGHQMEVGEVIFTERALMTNVASESGDIQETLSRWAQNFLNLAAVDQAAVLALYATDAIRAKLDLPPMSTCNPTNTDMIKYSDEDVKAILAKKGVHVPVEMMADTLQAVRACTTNSFSCESCSGLFVTLSRVNHSCEPNCLRVERKVGNDIYVDIVAIKPIQEGEELTITYIIEKGVVTCCARRQARLRQGWNFTCCCSVCGQVEDKYRVFACPSKGCKGTVRGLNARGLKEGNPPLSSCGKCGASPSKAASDRLLAAEAFASNELDRLERICMSLSFNPRDLPKALSAARKGGLTNEHWAVQSLCDMNYDYCKQTGDYQQAEVHISDKLSFWDTHLSWVSQRRAWIREAKADNLRRMGRFREAFELYCVSLAEMRCVRPDDKSQDVEDIRRSIGKALRGTKL